MASTYNKQTFVPYDKKLSIEENIARNGIITDEDMNRLEEGVDSAHRLIEEKMDKKFSEDFYGKLVGVNSSGDAVPVEIPGPPILNEEGILEFGQFSISELDENGTLLT